MLDGYEFSFTFITKISFKGAKPKIPLIRRFVVDNVSSGCLNRNLTDFALDKVSKCEGLQTKVGIKFLYLYTATVTYERNCHKL